MPMYAYKCSSCGYEKDVIQKFSDAPLRVCPYCEAEAFARQLTAPAFQLKGTGWYVTDFRDSGQKKTADKPGGHDAGSDAGQAGDQAGDKAGNQTGDKAGKPAGDKAGNAVGGQAADAAGARSTGGHAGQPGAASLSTAAKGASTMPAAS